MAGSGRGSSQPPASRRCGRRDEVVVREYPNRVGREPNAEATPGDLELGVVPLGLCEQGHAGGQPEGLVEVVEGELPADVAFTDVPFRGQAGGQHARRFAGQRQGPGRHLDVSSRARDAAVTGARVDLRPTPPATGS